MPDIVAAIRSNKAALARDEAAEMLQMARQWRRVETALEGQQLALAEEIARLEALGEAFSPSKLYRMERYQRLVAQMRTEINRFGADSAAIITEKQGEYAWLAQEEAASTIQTSLGAGAPDFALLNTQAVEASVGHMADGTTIHNHLKDVYGEAVDAMSREIITSTAQGLNPRVTAAAIRRGTGVALNKALVIARTEQMRIYREVGRAQYQESGLVKSYKRMATLSDRTCLGCLMADGEVYAVESAFEDHPQGRCLAPGTIVSGAPVEAFVSRDYRGDMFTIRTSSGKLVSVTPNHPVLTERGWVAAQFINKGDNIISERSLDGTSTRVSPDEYQVPTRVEDIPRTLSMNRLAAVPATAEDFHGDGANSDVYVVWANSLLRNRREIMNTQPFGDHDFSLRDIRKLLLASRGYSAAMQQSMFDSTSSFLRYPHAAQMFFMRNLIAAQLISRGLVAQHDIGVNKSQANSVARYIESLRQSVLGLPGQVPLGEGGGVEAGIGSARSRQLLTADSVSGRLASEQPTSLQSISDTLLRSVPAGSDRLNAVASNVILDSVLEVSCGTFSGHVYNLQTEAGWYSANGIITHNCALIPIVSGARELTWKSGETWLQEQDSSTQLRMMGPTRYTLWQEGDISLQDMKMHIEDEVWGGAWVPTPVGQLEKIAS